MTAKAVKRFSAKRPLTDDEGAEIQRMIASDPDNPELTDAQIAAFDHSAKRFQLWPRARNAVPAGQSSTRRSSL